MLILYVPLIILGVIGIGAIIGLIIMVKPKVNYIKNIFLRYTKK